MNSNKTKRQPRHLRQTTIRLKLITAFGGNVPLAQIALNFVNGHPEASEEYRRFKEWEKMNYQDYCRRKGIRLSQPTSSEGQ